MTKLAKTEKNRFYWIKLKTNFWESPEIDFLMSQKNGSDYVVLYLQLCTITANTYGAMIQEINEMIVPFDVNKIVRETKYFNYDTVTVALRLYQQLGLIFEQKDGIFIVANVGNMVGSESANTNAIRQRKFREKQKNKALLSVTEGVTKTVTDTVTQSVTDSVTETVTEGVTKCNEENKRLRDLENKSFRELECERLDNTGTHTQITLDDFRQFVKTKGFKTINPDVVYRKLVASGWKDKHGNCIHDLESLLEAWEIQSNPEYKKSSDTAQDETDSDFSDSDKALKVIEKLKLIEKLKEDVAEIDEVGVDETHNFTQSEQQETRGDENDVV